MAYSQHFSSCHLYETIVVFHTTIWRFVWLNLCCSSCFILKLWYSISVKQKQLKNLNAYSFANKPYLTRFGLYGLKPSWSALLTTIYWAFYFGETRFILEYRCSHITLHHVLYSLRNAYESIYTVAINSFVPQMDHLTTTCDHILWQHNDTNRYALSFKTKTRVHIPILPTAPAKFQTRRKHVYLGS